MLTIRNKYSNQILLASFVALSILGFGTDAEAAKLELSPTSGSYNVGDIFSTAIMLNTESVAIYGTDAVLTYDKSLLQVVDADPNVSGIQISAGSLMSYTVFNQVDSTIGKISFSQIPNGGQTYTGSGSLASVTFKAIAAGSASVNLVFSASDTTDSNVAGATGDLLSAVTGASYVISNPSSGSDSGGGSSSSGSSSSGSSSGGSSGSSSSGSGSSLSGTRSSSGTAFSNASQVSGTGVVVLTRTLYRGSEGSDVVTLQNFLIAKGYLASGNATGFFGPLTESAVKTFQRTEGLVSSGSPQTTGYGLVGVLTRARITLVSLSQVNVSAPAQTTNIGSVLLRRNLSRGSEGTDVTALQTFLISKGYLSAGNATGFFGPLTESAVKAFQRAEDIVSSGSPQTTGYGNVGSLTRARIEALTR